MNATHIKLRLYPPLSKDDSTHCGISGGMFYFPYACRNILLFTRSRAYRSRKEDELILKDEI